MKIPDLLKYFKIKTKIMAKLPLFLINYAPRHEDDMG
jgi:hypothetical protein